MAAVENNKNNEDCKGFGRPVIGWLCNYTPVEIIYAFNLQPYRLLGNFQKVTKASTYLHSMVCPYVRNCLDVALQGGYDFLDGIIINNSCMIMNSMYYLWRSYIKTPFVHFLDVPRMASSLGENFYKKNLQKTIDALSDHFGIPYVQADLLRAISLQNEIKGLLKEISSLRSEESYRVSTLELQKLVEKGFSCPQENYRDMLKSALEDMKQREPVNSNGKRILVTGAHYSNPEITPFLEDLGFQIVYDDLCVGTRYYEDKFCAVDSDPVRALAHSYLNQPKCARMADLQGRHARLLDIVKSLKIEGALFYLNRYCCTFTYDFSILKRKLDALSIPNLLIEGDYTSNNSEQVRIRLQAFAELLEARL